MNLQLDKNFLMKYLLRVVAIWLVLTVIVLYYGVVILKPSLHYFAVLSEFLASDYSIKMHDSIMEGESIIIMVIKSQQDIYTSANALLLARGTSTPVFAYTMNILVPVVILFSLILAWPFSSLKQYLTAIVVGLVFMQMILILTVPFQLLGIFENNLDNIAKSVGDAYDFSIWHYWQMFCDGGAVWLLALLSAMFVIAVAQAVPIKQQDELLY